MNDSATISAIIPCYNHAHFLRECLKSLCEQTFGDWEAIVVDDASPDSPEILRVVAERADPRIKVVHNAINRGIAASQNIGARASLGRYLVFVDADDFLRPTYFEKTVSVLEAHADIEVVFTAFERFGAESGIIFDKAYKSRFGEVFAALRYWIPGAGPVMRRHVWERIGGFCEDRRLHGPQDRVFWISSIGVVPDQNVMQLDEPLYCYRIHEASTSLNAQKKAHYQYQVIAEHCKTILDRLMLRKKFIAAGHLVSVSSSFYHSRPWQGLWLSLRGFMYDPSNLKLRKAVVYYLKELTPPSVRRVYRSLKRGVS
ncbi:MAG: glycosyltransferase family 2 protein [Chloroflexi bacterium CFX4]|nr:glycosyltransferase family 2 protein [Chloroflexi bacterium CFX4]MDL1923187.1 glycosyltransferase family 2 protein [Chloroflexi bacterium CFX3]